VEDVALKLNLKISVIKNIEDNLDKLIVDGTYSSIYLRGYLANYSKEVGLKNLASFLQYQQLSHPEKAVKSLKNPHLINPKTKSSNKLMLFVLLLLIIAIAAVAYVWNTSEEHSNNQNESNVQAENAVMQLPDSTEQVPDNAEQVPDNAEQVPDNAEQVPDNAEQAEVVITDEKDIDTVNEHSSPSVEVEMEKEQPDATNNTEVAELIEHTNSETIDEAEINLAVLETEEITETISEVEHTLRLKFTDECWTEVKDANGERLAFDLYQSGDELTLAGTPPFNLKLGKPSAVEIFYQDELVEKTFKSGQTTRFNLPE
ncbi:SpoIIIAH-like family protein, partial [Psychromonas sp.]|nr:SpoIIIAH-like family protein [Psychromonas sp.]